MLSKEIVLIIKCTRSCNLLCRYCKDRRSSVDSIPYPVIFSIINDILNNNSIESVKFVFHGGEPLLLGQSFFEKVVTVQKLANKRKINIKNTIQSNGTLITPDWCDFFVSNNIQLGISLDAPEHLHNSQRPFCNVTDGNSFASTINGIQLLNKHEVPFGILTVVSEAHSNVSPIDFIDLYIELSVDNVSLLLIQPSNDYLSHSKNRYINYLAFYSEFLCSVSDILLAQNNHNFKIREITSKIDSLLGNSPSVCTEGGFCVGKYFGIDINGDVSLCDSFFNTKMFTFGNLYNKNINELLSVSTLNIMVDIETDIRNRCSHCKWFPICVGGCLFDGMIYYSELSQYREMYCPNKQIYSHLSKKLYAELSPLIQPN